MIHRLAVLISALLVLSDIADGREEDRKLSLTVRSVRTERDTPLRREARQLRQDGEAPPVVFVRNAETLREELALSRGNQTFVLNTSEIVLDATLVIEKSNIALEGSREHPTTTIRCSRRTAESAIRVRAGLTRFASLRFVKCRRPSVVTIRAPRGDPQSEVHVRFEDVEFIGDGSAAGHPRGAAVRAEARRTTYCPIALRFVSCRFERNHAAVGGSVFAKNARIRIRNCTFEGNTADVAGGALFIENAPLSIKASRFEDNRAFGNTEEDDQSDQKTDDAQKLTRTQFGTTGGAIRAVNPLRIRIQTSNFTSNGGCEGGGALSVSLNQPPHDIVYSKAFNIVESRFVNNTAFCGPQPKALENHEDIRQEHVGGALMYESFEVAAAVWTVRNTTFHQNRAFKGGALGFYFSVVSTAEHNIRDSDFDQNVALVTGGSLFLFRSRATVHSSSFRSSNSTYGGGIAVWNAGGLNFDDDPRGDAPVSVVEGNIGSYGGGIIVVRGQFNATALIVRNNTAQRGGGGIWMQECTEPMGFRGIKVLNNRAVIGGGISMLAVSILDMTSFEAARTVFSGNIAAAGGGFLFEPGEAIHFELKIEFSNFVDNRVLTLNKKEMSDFVEKSFDYTPLPEANLTRKSLKEELGTDLNIVQFLTSAPEGHGGGIAFSFMNLRPYAITQVIVQNITVEKNKADVGGGLSVAMTKLFWNRDREKETCFPVIFGFEVCQIFRLHGATVRNNSAKFAAGVFFSYAGGISISCGPGHDVLLPSEDHEWMESNGLTQYCSNVTGNVISDGADIKAVDAASGLVKLVIEGWDEKEPLTNLESGQNIRLPCMPSNGNASCIHRPLRIAVKDIFDQTIVRGIEDANLTLTLLSDDIVGDQRYPAVNGIAEINSTRPKKPNVTDGNLTIVSERHPDVSITIHFLTRECYPGEVEDDLRCQSCGVDQYSFHPHETCRSCEDNAICGGGAALVPADGYWHSTPFSPVFRKCISDKACQYDERRDDLEAFYNNDDQNMTTLRAELRALQDIQPHRDGTTAQDFAEVYPQCDRGYRGYLCGSCIPGYGRAYNGVCQKCPDGVSHNGLSILLTIGWRLMLIGLNCAVTLMSMNSRIDLVRHEQEESGRGNTPRVLRNQCGRKGIVVESPRSSKVRGRPSAEDFDNDPSGRLAFSQQLVATAQLTETLKILINYLQVTGTALRLQANWNGLLRVFLRIQNGFAGLSDELFAVPHECNFENSSIHDSIGAVWVRLLSPWIALIAIELLYLVVTFVCHLIRRCRNAANLHGHHSGERFLTFIIVIAVVSIYFSYIDVVRELLRAINCVKIYESTHYVKEDHPYIRYATETVDVHVWVEDTDLVCLRGNHLPVGIIGIVGLFFSVCGILSIALWLPLNKKNKTNPEFVARYWFLYQAYKPEWYTVAWESTVLARKSLLAAVVVFSNHLGPSLQASACAGLLTVFLSLQAFFSPFKIPENHRNVPQYAGGILRAIGFPKCADRWIQLNNGFHLNMLESASLTASIVMFYSAIVLQSPASTLMGCCSIEVLAFSVNLAFMLYMFYRLYAGMHLLLDLKLSIVIEERASQEHNLGLFAFVRKAFSLLQIRRRAHQPNDVDHTSNRSSVHERGSRSTDHMTFDSAENE